MMIFTNIIIFIYVRKQPKVTSGNDMIVLYIVVFVFVYCFVYNKKKKKIMFEPSKEE